MISPVIEKLSFVLFVGLNNTLGIMSADGQEVCAGARCTLHPTPFRCMPLLLADGVPALRLELHASCSTVRPWEWAAGAGASTFWRRVMYTLLFDLAID